VAGTYSPALQAAPPLQTRAAQRAAAPEPALRFTFCVPGKVDEVVGCVSRPGRRNPWEVQQAHDRALSILARSQPRASQEVLTDAPHPAGTVALDGARLTSGWRGHRQRQIISCLRPIAVKICAPGIL